MPRLPIFALALALMAVACGRDSAPNPPKMAEVMPNVPLPPQATFVSRAGGVEALQITVRSPARADAVAAYYREVFKKDGWRLVNDSKDQEGAVVLFAEQNGPPLWVRIWTDDVTRGTLVELAGARLSQKPDTSKTAARPSAKPTS